jgi:ABC-type Na+ efflux pump permease subunit
MIPIPDDLLLLLVLIVSVIIVLLLIFSFFYYLFKSRRQPEKASPAPDAVSSPMVPAAEVTGMRPGFSRNDTPDKTHYSDISEEIFAVRNKYSLDSLTVASYDGLVVISSGNPSAESDAAYFAQRVKTGEKIGKDGVSVNTVEFMGSLLLIITRSSNGLPDDQVDSIKNDIRWVLRDWL